MKNSIKLVALILCLSLIKLSFSMEEGNSAVKRKSDFTEAIVSKKPLVRYSLADMPAEVLCLIFEKLIENSPSLLRAYQNLASCQIVHRNFFQIIHEPYFKKIFAKILKTKIASDMVVAPKILATYSPEIIRKYLLDIPGFDLGKTHYTGTSVNSFLLDNGFIENLESFDQDELHSFVLCLQKDTELTKKIEFKTNTFSQEDTLRKFFEFLEDALLANNENAVRLWIRAKQENYEDERFSCTKEYLELLENLSDSMTHETRSLLKGIFGTVKIDSNQRHGYYSIIRKAVILDRMNLLLTFFSKKFHEAYFKYALECASEYGKIDMIRLLLHLCSDKMQKYLDPSLYSSAFVTHQKEIIDFLSATYQMKFDVKAIGYDHRLISNRQRLISYFKSKGYSSERSCEESFKVLEEYFKGINDKSFDARSLCIACYFGYIDIVKLLLSKIKYSDEELYNALQVAALQGNEFLARLLIDEYNAPINFDISKNEISDRIGIGLTGYYYCCSMFTTIGLPIDKSALALAAEQGDLHMIELLLSYGAKDINGALKAAVANGHMDVIKLMIAKLGLPTNEFLDKRLFNAVEKSDLALIKYLLELGARIDSLNAEEESLLFSAILANTEVLEFIVNQKNIDINLKNSFGETALEYLIKKAIVGGIDDDQCIIRNAEILIKHGAKIDDFEALYSYAVEEAASEICEFLKANKSKLSK